MIALAYQCSGCGTPLAEPFIFGGQDYCSFCVPRDDKSLPVQRTQEPTDDREYAVPLRPPQADCVTNIFAEFQDGSSTLAVMPTGTGKTVVIAGVVERWPNGRMLVVAHREELIRQNREKIQRFAGIDCDVEMAEQRADQCGFYQRCPVVVTSIQTMCRDSRHSRFRPEDFSLLVIDEAHHACADTYRRVIEYFSQNPNLKILGVTATPDRADERALGQIFKTVAFDYSIIQAIDDGWLVPIQQQFIQIEGLDLSSVKTTAGDLNAKQLGAILEQEKILHEYAWPTIEQAQGEKTLMFAASVDQAEQLSGIFNRHQAGCSRWICADQTRCTHDERVEALAGFTNGDFQFLVNCGILLEGYDEPSIKVVAVARPTKSRSLYAQMIGRGTRPLTGIVDGMGEAIDRRLAIARSGKPSLLILDYVGNSGRHKLIHSGDVLGGDYDDDVIAEAAKEVQAKSNRNERADMLVELRAAEERKRQRILHAKQVTAKAKYQSFSVDPFAVYDILPKREPGWFAGKKPTEKQLAFLDKAGIPTKDLSFCRASQLIEETIKRRDKKLCTFKQARILRKHGFDADNAGFSAASTIIDTIVKSGWTLRGPVG
jgi:superfamily II DNA or RNA helicase